MEKLLVCEALDERDLLEKKIKDAIDRAKFCTVRREKDPKTKNGQTDEEFCKEAKAAYQSITDMIDRRNRINAAIVLSNANTVIKLRSGLELTVAAAITKRRDMSTKDDLEMMFIKDLIGQAHGLVEENKRIKDEKERKESSYKANFSSRENKLSEEDAKAISVLLAGEDPVMVDPLDIVKLANEKTDAYNQLAKELDTAIKISNATTVVEF
jgi:hypothetical protein